MSQAFDLTDLGDALHESTERIIFQVFHEEGMACRYRTTLRIKMSSVMRFHAKQLGVPADTFDFWFHGRIVYGYETPKSLRLEPEDVIVAEPAYPPGPSSRESKMANSVHLREAGGSYAGYKEASDEFDEGSSAGQEDDDDDSEQYAGPGEETSEDVDKESSTDEDDIYDPDQYFDQGDDFETEQYWDPGDEDDDSHTEQYPGPAPDAFAGAERRPVSEKGDDHDPEQYFVLDEYHNYRTDQESFGKDKERSSTGEDARHITQEYSHIPNNDEGDEDTMMLDTE